MMIDEVKVLKKGFDNEKYLKMQSEHIKERIAPVSYTHLKEEDAWSAKEKLVNPTSAQKVMGKLGGLFKH